MTPGRYLGYTTSTIAILCVLWALYEGFTHMSATFLSIYGAVLGGVLVVAIIGLFALKGWAMLKVDTAEAPKKRVASPRVPAKRG